ncbi:pentatricopeptide repeat-containing protein At3g16610-like [Herrania umbratica]|uniref:Pentatricopeptide repeat-containing protein At3g16610-like n=1 Tax=Herrania umbratica TaxID=108875 RepID=A0A6J0ZTU3_9ROSI|nr:pentatricopeptide repeat-containing protein At3g16610-like [Herrania umbratica]
MLIPFPLSLHFAPKNTHIKDDPEKYWNSLIKNQTNLKNDHAILSTYSHMESLGLTPNRAALPLVLKACVKLNAVETGKRIHLSIRNTNLIEDVRVGTAIIDFYCKCGFIEEARKVFDEMVERDLVSWNAMISGYAGCGEFEEVVFLVMRMQREGFRPNSRTLVAMLLACQEVAEVRLGKEIQGYCLRNGLFDLDSHVGTALIGFYLSFNARASQTVFDLMAVRNTVCWNAMIKGCFHIGESLKALKLFEKMLIDGVEFDSVTMLALIQACAEFGSLELGSQIHQMAIKCSYSNDLFIINALLNMYADIGSLKSACKLFYVTPRRDVALWNSMISAFFENSCNEEATSLFVQMRTEGNKEDERTIVIMFSLCAESADGLRKGKSLHAYASKSGMRMDVNLGNAMLNMYAQQNCIDSVQKVFSEMSNVDVISFNTVILTLARNKLGSEAGEVFGLMREFDVEPNSYTIISILAACKDETCLNVGRSLHGFVIKQGIEVNASLNTALTDMYINCGDETTARNLFESCPGRDLISWNALIATYVKKNLAHDAFLVFSRMISEVEPNSVTIINILSSCTHLAHLPQGQCLHAYMLRRESSLGHNLSLGNAFITMYARCGSMQSAERIFKTLPRRNIISWNAIIAGYGMHGRGSDAILAFSQMLEDGYYPNEVTFISILSACSHSGMIEEGLRLFDSMVQDFHITPQLAHYGCVVDLLGRAGCLDEARGFIESMPIKPDASVWRTLLSAYRDHCYAKEAKAIFEKIVELDPMNPGNYVLLCNTYAAAGLWSDVRQIRTCLRAKGLRKPPGMSWIIVRSQIHSFAAGDRSHPMADKINANLNSLLHSMKDIGYVPDLHWILHVDEEYI